MAKNPYNLPGENQAAKRPILVILATHFTNFGRFATIIVPLNTSYWTNGGPYLLFQAIQEAKKENPGHALFLDRLLDPKTNPTREYAQATFVPVRPRSTQENPAEVRFHTVTDTRDPSFRRFLGGPATTQGEDPRPVEGEEDPAEKSEG